jgi:hypothetical protein
MASYSNPFSGSPYRIGGLPTLSSMNKQGGFQLVSPQTMALANLGQQPRTMFGMSRRGDARMGGNMFTNPDDEAATALGYGGNQSGNDGRLSRLRGLLTGEGGAAIGGVAQGLGSVVGAYLNRKTERERMKEEKRARAAEEANNAQIRKYLMPLVEEQIARQRGYQQDMDRKYGSS